MSKFERKGVYYYDIFKNEILFSTNLKDNYDIDHLLMKGILEMSTATNSFTGFNSDERLVSLLTKISKEELAKFYASLGDVYINDAFGTLHRAHASNSGLASNLPSGVGLLVYLLCHNLIFS